jgi:FMN phosphatase YigB (HAD superfamily)
MIRGIIFDFFGVLYGGSLQSIMSQCPPDRSDELRDLNKQVDYGFISGDDYIMGLAEIFAMPIDELRGLLRQKHVRNQELIDFVATLRPAYKVGLLSNVGSNTLDTLMSKNERNILFDAEVLSFQEHMLKPNSAIFALIAERLGVSPGDCVMIDDLAENCEGAEVAGMQSIQHISNERTKDILYNLLQD